MSDERYAQLDSQHPDELGPIEGWDANRFFFQNPTRDHATVDWLAYRENLLLRMQQKPGNTNIPIMLAQCDLVLSYRAAQPPEDSFWLEDTRPMSIPVESSPNVPIENSPVRYGSVASVSTWRLDVGEFG